MNRIKQLKLFSLGAIFLKFLFDDFKKLITEVLNGAPEIDGIILLGPNTDIKSNLINYINQLVSKRNWKFLIYGNDKDQIQCDIIKIPSNNIYLYTHRKRVDVCHDINENQLITLFNAIDMTLYYVPWLDYNRVHFELFSDLTLTTGQILRDVTELPTGSTLINTASTHYTIAQSVNKELLLKSFLVDTDNPYIRYMNYLIANPGNNIFAINVGKKTEIFTSNINSLTLFSDSSVLLWQQNQIKNFITFFTKHTRLIFSNKEERFVEFIEQNLSDHIAFITWHINHVNLNLKRYKEFMLFNLIVQCAIEKVKNLLDNNVDIDAALYDKSTSLHISASLNNIQITELLITLGANIDAVKNNQATPLMLSSLRNYTETTELLLKSGADTNASDMNNNTALHLSTFKGYTQVVEQLLKFDADINLINNKHATSFMIAVETNNINMVKLLLAHAPDLEDVMKAYERGIKPIQIEIFDYKCNPALYVLRHNHEVSQCLKSLNNVELYNRHKSLYNTTALEEYFTTLDNHKSYINLLPPFNVFFNEENDCLLGAVAN